MELDDVLAWFNAKGFPFRWRSEPKVNGDLAILRPKNGNTLTMGELEVAIVLPDIHLGAGNDVFSRGVLAQSYGARLTKFLNALAELRDQLGADKFRVVQVGDWYDFYRAPLPTAAAQVQAIEAQYPGVCNAARALPVWHCIGNHDAALYKEPNATTSRFGIAQPVGSNRMVAYHGHDTKTLEAIENADLGAAIALNIVDVVALFPILSPLANFFQMVADDSFEEVWTKGNTAGDKPWEKANGIEPAAWTAPWVHRDDEATLVRAARGLEYVTDEPVEVVFIGHSHRPGISWAWITAQRQTALVDAGSWTYGRAEIAIVTPNGIGLAEIPIV